MAKNSVIDLPIGSLARTVKVDEPGKGLTLKEIDTRLAAAPANARHEFTRLEKELGVWIADGLRQAARREPKVRDGQLLYDSSWPLYTVIDDSFRWLGLDGKKLPTKKETAIGVGGGYDVDVPHGRSLADELTELLVAKLQAAPGKGYKVQARYENGKIEYDIQAKLVGSK